MTSSRAQESTCAADPSRGVVTVATCKHHPVLRCESGHQRRSGRRYLWLPKLIPTETNERATQSSTEV
eukprot:3838042-Prymnesium_polylepis.2